MTLLFHQISFPAKAVYNASTIIHCEQEEDTQNQTKERERKVNAMLLCTREREREWLCVCVCVNICISNRKTGLVREGDFLNALSITCTNVAVLLQLLAPQCLPKTTFTARISLHYLMVQHDWEIHKHTQDILVYGKNPWRNTLFVAHIGTAQLPP